MNNQLEEMSDRKGMFRIKDITTQEPIKVTIEYSLPDMIVDSYGEMVLTEKIFPETHAMMDVYVDVNMVFPKMLVCGVPFSDTISYEEIILNERPNTYKTMENEITIRVANAKYLFIGYNDDYVLDSILHVESGRYITDYFETTDVVDAIAQTKDYTVREYIFGRDDIDATYTIKIKKGE